MANYYDEYRNDLYNPDDGHDTKKPGRNANWKAIQKGFKDTQSEIDRLDGRVDELEERVETAEEHVANLEERVTAEEAINREQQVQINANTAKNEEQDTRLDGIDDAIERIDAKDAEQDGRLDTIEEEQDEQDILIREHGNRLTAHDASIADINTRISQINAKDNEQDDAIEDLQGRMTDVEAEQEVERQEHAEIKQNIQQINLDIGLHDRLIAQNAQNIANNAQAIQDEATNRVNADTDLRTRIDANAQAIQDEADARETADQRIENKVDTVREEFDECCEEVKADITRIDTKDAEQDALLTDHGRRLTADEQMLADHGDRITALEGRTTQNESDITQLRTDLDAKSAALDAGLTPIASVKDGTTVNQVTDDAFNALQNEEVDVYGNVEGVLKKVEYVVTDANTITVTDVGVITKSGNEYSISWVAGVTNADISLCEKGLIASDEKVESVAQELGEDIQNLSDSMRWKNGSGTNAVQMIESSANGANSTAEGLSTTAGGVASHSEGQGSRASGSNSHAEGNYTIANHRSQHVFGEYNIFDDSGQPATNRGNFVEIVGNGNDTTRSNARTLDWNGNEVLAGNLTLGMGSDAKTLTKEKLGSILSPIPVMQYQHGIGSFTANEPKSFTYNFNFTGLIPNQKYKVNLNHWIAKYTASASITAFSYLNINLYCPSYVVTANSNGEVTVETTLLVTNLSTAGIPDNLGTNMVQIVCRLFETDV